MRGHIVEEDRFLHQGIDHHLFVTAADGTEREYRFEVRRIAPGGADTETIYEKIVDFSPQLTQTPSISIEQLIQAELQTIKEAVNAEEDIHAHDP
jgi:hypothetical protein